MKKRIASLLTAFVLVCSLVLPLVGCGRAPTGFEVRTEGFQTSYVVGAEVDYSPISIIVSYDDKTTETVKYENFAAFGVDFTGINTETAGEKNIRIEYAGQSELIPVTVTAQKAPVSVELAGTGFPLEYRVGDAVDYDKIALLVVYNDGSNETVKASENDGITYTSIDTSTAGEKDFTVRYAGLSVTVKVIVEALPEVQSIEIKEGTFAAEYETADEIDYNAIVLVVTYANNDSEELSVLDNSGIVLTKPVITLAGEYTLKIAFGGKETSATFRVNTDEAKVTKVELSVAEGKTSYKQGDDIDYSAFTVKATYEGVAEPVTLNLSSSKVSYTAIDTSAKADEPYLFTVNVGGVTSNAVEIAVAYVKSLELKNLKSEYTVRETFDPACDVVLHYSDDTSETVRYNAAGMTNNSADIDTDEVGTSEYKVTYTLVKGGQTINTVSVTAQITVKAADKLTAFTKPVIVTDYEDGKNAEGENAFLDKTQGYTAGDDNPLVFLPYATDGEYEVMAKVETVATVSLLEEGGTYTKLSGESLSVYLAIDSANNYYDFTEAAVGKTFRIAVEPSAIYDTTMLANKTFTVDVTVVDGYNVYDATGLSAFDSRTDSGWDAVKATKTYAWDGKPLAQFSPAAIVLHGDIIVEATDLPETFFWDEEDDDWDGAIAQIAEWEYELEGQENIPLSECLSGTLREGDKAPVGNGDTSQVALFESRGHKGIYGNYTTLTVADDLKVVYDRNMYGSDGSWSGVTEPHYSLLGYVSAQDEEGVSSLRDLYLVGNTRREESNGPQGIMMIHTESNDLQTENVVGINFFTNFIADGNYFGNLTIRDSKYFDSYSNMIYDWQSESITIENTTMKDAGGPLFLLVDSDSENSAESNTYVSWTVTGCTLENWVTGQEAWFALNNATSIASMLSAMATKVNNASYAFTKNESGVYKMNIIAGMICDPADLIPDGNREKVYAKFTLDGEVYDTAGMCQQLGASASYAPLVQCGAAWGVLMPTDQAMTSFSYVDLVAMNPNLPFGKLAEQKSEYAGLYVSLKQSQGYIGVILKGDPVA